MFGHNPIEVPMPPGMIPFVHLSHLIEIFSEANQVCFVVSDLCQPLSRLGKTLVGMFIWPNIL